MISANKNNTAIDNKKLALLEYVLGLDIDDVYLRVKKYNLAEAEDIQHMYYICVRDYSDSYRIFENTSEVFIEIIDNLDLSLDEEDLQDILLDKYIKHTKIVLFSHAEIVLNDFSDRYIYN